MSGVRLSLKNGVILRDGTVVPYGANIAVPAWSVHHDQQVYERPFGYDALRFSRQREDLSGGCRNVDFGGEGWVEDEKGFVGLEVHAIGTYTAGENHSFKTQNTVLSPYAPRFDRENPCAGLRHLLTVLLFCFQVI